MIAGNPALILDIKLLIVDLVSTNDSEKMTFKRSNPENSSLTVYSSESRVTVLHAPLVSDPIRQVNS